MTLAYIHRPGSLQIPDGLLFEREIGAWLMPFMQNGSPEELARVHALLMEQMNDGEFIDPLTLKKEMTLALAPDAPKGLRDIIGALHYFSIASNMDRFSGGFRKTLLAETTGLFHLHAKVTKTPVACIEVDFSNQGGANINARQMLAAARSVPLAGVDQAEAVRFVDRCARIVVEKIRTEIDSMIHPNKCIVLRAGGDELRIIVPGLDPVNYSDLLENIHEQIEDITATLGMHEIPHLKDPQNPVRRGFGCACAIIDMRSITDIGTDFSKLDEEIKRRKESLGRIRAGLYNEVQLVEIFTGYLKKNPNEKHTVVQMVASYKRYVHDRSRDLKNMAVNAGTDPSVLPEERLENIERVLQAGEQHYDVTRNFAIASGCNALETDGEKALFDCLSNEGEAWALFDSPEQRGRQAVMHYIASHHIELSKYQEQLFEHILSVLSPTDPVTGTWLDRDMPACLNIYRNDTAKLAQKIGNPDVAPKLVRIGFHNAAGLNEILGHEGTNAILKHFATLVIGEMHRQGLELHKNYEIAHYGAGQFQLLIQPGYQKVDGTWQLYDDIIFERVEKNLITEAARLNRTGVRGFLLQNGIADIGVSPALLFGQIPDSKGRLGVEGINVTSILHTCLPIDEKIVPVRAGRVLENMRIWLEEAVELFRRHRENEMHMAMQMQARMSEPAPEPGGNG